MSRHAPQNRLPLPQAMGATLLALTLGLSGCAQATPTATTAALSVPAQAGPAQPLVNLPDFTPIIDRYGPTVVNISSTSSKALAQEHNPFPPDSPFYRFFKHFGGSQGGHGAAPQEKIQSLGSGFILSSDGYIVTAAHVVRGAQHIVVTLTNHHAYPAKLVGLSVRYDTALLKIDAQGLPTAPLGNSDDLRVGQWLLAVGAPFGFFNTVTQGVVSATNRPLPDDEYIPFIQSDVPINPG
ncbi:MAG: trypsin-like peptidase domain-containing protein, partial [Acidithiobacillus sp.]